MSDYLIYTGDFSKLEPISVEQAERLIYPFKAVMIETLENSDLQKGRIVIIDSLYDDDLFTYRHSEEGPLHVGWFTWRFALLPDSNLRTEPILFEFNLAENLFE